MTVLRLCTHPPSRLGHICHERIDLKLRWVFFSQVQFVGKFLSLKPKVETVGVYWWPCINASFISSGLRRVSLKKLLFPTRQLHAVQLIRELTIDSLCLSATDLSALSLLFLLFHSNYWGRCSRWPAGLSPPSMSPWRRMKSHLTW